MNKQLAILLTGLLAHGVVLAPAPAPAQTQTEIKFYCGKSYDPLSKKDIPTTLVSSPNREKPSVLVIWKSEYFPKYAPQQRCDLVSPKFQAAYVAGRLEYLVTGTHKGTGSQIVCGVANQDESCDSNANMLFTLKPYSDGAAVLKQLVGSTEGEAGPNLYQSSGNREVFSLRALLKAKK